MADTWVEVAADDALAPGQMRAFSHAGRRLLHVFTADRHYVLDEMCTHEDYSLALGCIKGDRIKCSLHGSHFDLATGAALDEPADAPLRTYPVRLADGKVWARL